MFDDHPHGEEFELQRPALLMRHSQGAAALIDRAQNRGRPEIICADVFLVFRKIRRRRAKFKSVRRVYFVAGNTSPKAARRSAEKQALRPHVWRSRGRSGVPLRIRLASQPWRASC